MLLITNYTVTTTARQLNVELPLEIELADDVRGLLAQENDHMHLRVQRRVDRDAMELAVEPEWYHELSDGRREPVIGLRLKNDEAVEPVLVHDFVSALSFLTEVPMALSRPIHDDCFMAEGDEDQHLLDQFGTNRPFIGSSSAVASLRTTAGPVTAERIAALLPSRRIGLRIYADALKSTFAPAQFRELWRVLESAFSRKDEELVGLLATYPPAVQLGFVHGELQELLVLRGRASHATSKPETALEEVVHVEHQCTAALPRLRTLAERVITTKRSWGYPTPGVDEVLPLRGYVGPKGELVFIRS